MILRHYWYCKIIGKVVKCLWPKIMGNDTNVCNKLEGGRMVDIVLVEPEIPNNTGAIARTCACTGARLHLIKPLGFDISDSAVKRAGLDYWYLVDIRVYDNIDEYFKLNGDANLWLTTTKAPRSYADCDWSGDVTLMFGKETAGLPEWLREKYRDKCVRIPMISEARSLNLSNAAAILTYEALRQQGFKGLKDYGNMKQEESA